MPPHLTLEMPTELRPLDAERRDTRRGITRLTVDVPAPSRPGTGLNVKPSRWNTPEFYLYYFVFLLAVPWMVWVPVSLSQASHSNYNLYQHLLRPGWLFGRKYDNSDVQYRSFRSNIPALSAFLAVYFILKRIYVRAAGRTPYASVDNTYILPFYTIFSLIMLFALHGTSALKVLVILSCNFAIVRIGRGSRWVVLATWIFNAGVLFANEWYGGYRYANIMSQLAFLVRNLLSYAIH